MPEGGDRGERHAHRAADAVLTLVPEIAERSTRDMSTGARVCPRERMRATAEDHLHQLVVGGMELHDVDAMAEAVVRAQLRRVAIGLARQRLHLLAADERASVREVVSRPIRAEDLDGFSQRLVI